MIKKSLELGSKGISLGHDVGGTIWRFIKSDECILLLKAVAAGAAFVHSIEELRKMRRRIGFTK